METRFLGTLLSIVETGSITETARQLNITPSAVVQRIKALEDEIGQTLIQRAGHSMRPTHVTISMLDDIHQLLATERNLISAAGVKPDAGLLKIGLVQSVMNGILPRLLRSLNHQYPAIEVRIITDVSSTLYDQVIRSDIDLAIITRPPFRLAKDAGWSELRREKSILLTSADLTGDNPHEILRQESFIRYDRNYWGGRALDIWQRKNKLRLKQIYELNSLDTIALLVSLSVGVSIVPDWMPPWPEGVRLRKLEIPDAPEREIGIIWSRANKSLPLIETILRQTHQIFSNVANS